MKKSLIILSIIITSINCYSQIKFEKGFYIDNDGQKTECLIKNIDWSVNVLHGHHATIPEGQINSVTNAFFDN